MPKLISQKLIDGQLVDLQVPEWVPTLSELMEDPYSDVDLKSDNPWRVPDWRDPDNYTWMENRCWHWEFTRRSNSYRDLWIRMQEHRRAKPSPYVCYQCLFDVMTKYNVEFMGPHFDSRHEEVKAGEKRRILSWMRSDSLTAQPVQPTIAVDTEILSGWVSNVVEKGLMLAYLDPWQPLDRQIEYIKCLVGAYRVGAKIHIADPPKANRFRMREDKYALYLRLLDSRDRYTRPRCPISEIVTVLASEKKHPFVVNEDSVKKMIRQARNTQRKFVPV